MMKANEIQETLLKWYYPKGRKIATTNFHAAGLHEADVLMVSKDGMVYEYEVKCSLSDFKADFKKEHKHKMLSDKSFRETEFKYYDKGWFCCPNYFYYACKKDVIPIASVPAYAGLVYIENGIATVMKKGKKLHNYKATERLYASILQCLSARMIYGCSYMNYIRQNK